MTDCAGFGVCAVHTAGPTPVKEPAPAGSGMAAPASAPAPAQTAAGTSGAAGGDTGWLTSVLLAGLVVAVAVAALLLVLWLAARRRARSIVAAPRPADPERRAERELDGVLIRLADVVDEGAVVQAERALAMIGIEPIPVRSGDPFDDRVHQVAATEESPDPEHDDRIASEVRRGWRRGPQVVRPADVSLWVPTHR